MGKDKFAISEKSMMRAEIEDLRRRLTRLERRMPGYGRLPEVVQRGDYLQISFRREMAPDEVYRIPAEEIRLHQEWRPVKEKDIHTRPRPKFNEADCGHKVMSKLTTCSRCGKEWEETKVKLDE